MLYDVLLRSEYVKLGINVHQSGNGVTIFLIDTLEQRVITVLVCISSRFDLILVEDRCATSPSISLFVRSSFVFCTSVTQRISSVCLSP